jgi:hypothetical protein
MAQSAGTTSAELVKNADEFQPSAPAGNARERARNPLLNRPFPLILTPLRGAGYRLAGNIHDS